MANESEKCQENLQPEELYSWISTIPISKPKKNLTRDFSDAVLMAEVLKVYYPRYVDLHNYVPVNSVSTKKENWDILNRKVLSKIDMKLTKETISQLANSQPGAAEQLLMELRSKLLKNPDQLQNLSGNDKEGDFGEEGKVEENEGEPSERNGNSSPHDNLSVLKTINCRTSVFVQTWKSLVQGFCWIISWLYIWTYFPNLKFKSLLKSFPYSRKEDANASTARRTSGKMNEKEDSVPRHVCAQLKQELREKEDIICTLNHKLAYLESAVKLRELKISNLNTQILQNAVDSEQAIKIQSKNGVTSKLRSSLQTVREKSKVEE